MSVLEWKSQYSIGKRAVIQIWIRCSPCLGRPYSPMNKWLLLLPCANLHFLYHQGHLCYTYTTLSGSKYLQTHIYCWEYNTGYINNFFFMFFVVLLYMVDEFQKCCIKFKSCFEFPWYIFYLKEFYFELFLKIILKSRSWIPNFYMIQVEILVY